MPLDSSALQSGILAVCTSPGPSSAACAQQWANALEGYVQGVIPPLVPGVATEAASKLASSLAGAFAAPGGAAAGMEAALLVFALDIGKGMAPAFVAAPPPRPVGFTAMFLLPSPPTPAAAASRTASLIDGWLRTATATPAAGGSPSFWQ